MVWGKEYEMGHGNDIKTKISSIPVGKEIKSENFKDIYYYGSVQNSAHF